MTVIETERLFLREMTVADLPALCAVFCDAEAMRYYPYPFSETEVWGWIDRNVERYRVFGFGLWAVCLKGTGEVIGDCGLTMQRIRGEIRPEIGYHIRRDVQRRGYAAEAARAVRDWAFAHTPFNVLYSYMKCANVPSQKTAAAYGCRWVDEYEEDGEMTAVYAVARSEGV